MVIFLQPNHVKFTKVSACNNNGSLEARNHGAPFYINIATMLFNMSCFGSSCAPDVRDSAVLNVKTVIRGTSCVVGVQCCF